MITTSTISLRLYGICDIVNGKQSDFMLGQKISKTAVQLNFCRKTMYFPYIYMENFVPTQISEATAKRFTDLDHSRSL